LLISEGKKLFVGNKEFENVFFLYIYILQV
jgi:hypothetical protein